MIQVSRVHYGNYSWYIKRRGSTRCFQWVSCLSVSDGQVCVGGIIGGSKAHSNHFRPTISISHTMISLPIVNAPFNITGLHKRIISDFMFNNSEILCMIFPYNVYYMILYIISIMILVCISMAITVLHKIIWLYAFCSCSTNLASFQCSQRNVTHFLIPMV